MRTTDRIILYAIMCALFAFGITAVAIVDGYVILSLPTVLGEATVGCLVFVAIMEGLGYVVMLLRFYRAFRRFSWGARA